MLFVMEVGFVVYYCPCICRFRNDNHFPQEQVGVLGLNLLYLTCENAGSTNPNFFWKDFCTAPYVNYTCTNVILILLHKERT